jgi:hypothetical protein
MNVLMNFSMNYPLLLNATQVIGLVCMACSAIAALRLLSMRFVLREWNEAAAQSFRILATVQAIGLLAFAFASGGLAALHFVQTSNLPPPHRLVFQILLISILISSVIFKVAIARPWLSETPAGPLVRTLNVHRLTAMTLAYAGFAAAWINWVVMAASDAAYQPNVGHIALMTMLFWSVLAVPSLLLCGIFAYARPQPEEREPGSVLTVDRSLLDRNLSQRQMPQLHDIPEMRPIHIPARRAPRPLLVPREEYAGSI